MAGPVLYQDAHMIAVNKPSGLLVHRGWDNDPHTALTLARDLAGTYVYPVHRLDRGASGVLLFALTKDAAREIHTAIEAGSVTKRYLAIVRGVPPDSIAVDHPVPKGEAASERVTAVTHFARLKTHEGYSLVEAKPLTGRLHQIRRHLKHLAHPILGDVNYGKGDHNRRARAEFGLHRLALHAASVSLQAHWMPGLLTIDAPLPDDFRLPLERMGLL